MSLVRRGACPGVSHPMLTGDGLLARLLPSAPMPLNAFVALCEAAQACGNGIVEVTQRGSLQVRGLSTDSAALFARTVIALGLGDAGLPPILTSPLLGLGAEKQIDVPALLGALRAELTRRFAAAAATGPKVSLLIDEGVLHLDEVPADLRLQASTSSRWHMSIAGNAATAASLGWVEPRRSVEAVAQVLCAIADRGVSARARDFSNDVDLRALRAPLAGLLSCEPPPPLRPRAEPIGTHSLKDGSLACGIALAFGFAHAHALYDLARKALHCGATSIRPAPGRALLIIGLNAPAAVEFAAVAACHGFVVKPNDVRRYVVACAGAPACASATLPSRQLAPAIAQAAQGLLDGSMNIHISGCAKGCAHGAIAALNLVGPDGIVIQGRAGDAPQGRFAPTNLIAGLRRLQQERLGQESGAELISRLGARRVVQSLGGQIGP